MLKMVTFNHIKHESIGSDASPIIKKSGSVPTRTKNCNMFDLVWNDKMTTSSLV